MGDPRKLRKKYSKPSHPWQKLRIDEERVLMREFGLKNKKELWRLNSQLGVFKIQVKELVPRKDAQAEKEKKALLEKLQSYNLINKDAILEDILSLTLKDMCERRLQTIVFKRGFSQSMKQARQFVTHGHVTIAGSKIKAPSYIVNAKEEALLGYADNSSFKDEAHPERAKILSADNPGPAVKEEKVKTEDKSKKLPENESPDVKLPDNNMKDNNVELKDAPEVKNETKE